MPAPAMFRDPRMLDMLKQTLLRRGDGDRPEVEDRPDIRPMSPTRGGDDLPIQHMGVMDDLPRRQLPPQPMPPVRIDRNALPIQHMGMPDTQRPMPMPPSPMPLTRLAERPQPMMAHPGNFGGNSAERRQDGMHRPDERPMQDGPRPDFINRPQMPRRQDDPRRSQAALQGLAGAY